MLCPDRRALPVVVELRPRSAAPRLAPASAGAAASSSRRTRTTDATTPSAAITAPTQKAAWNPVVSASGTASPERAALSVCETATEERIAIPSAPPICCDVLISPEARPASFASIPARAAIEIETNANGIPIPTIRKPGSRSTTYEPPTDTCVNQSIPTVSRVIPVTSTGLTPILRHELRGDGRPDDRRARHGEVREPVFSAE